MSSTKKSKNPPKLWCEGFDAGFSAAMEEAASDAYGDAYADARAEYEEDLCAIQDAAACSCAACRDQRAAACKEVRHTTLHEIQQRLHVLSRPSMTERMGGARWN